MGLPLLNPKYEKFAQMLAAGKPVSEAFTEAGYATGTSRQLHKRANTLRNKPHVKARIDELVAERLADMHEENVQVREKVALSKEYVLTRLMENVERAMQAVPVLNSKGVPTGEYRYEGTVANKALELLGREMGMFIQKAEVGAPGEFAAIEDPNKMRELIVRRLSLAGPKIIEGEVIDDE